MNTSKLLEKYKNLTPRKQKQVAALTAGLGATLAAMGWIAFAPDKHSSLEKWDERYSDKCYSHDEDEPDLKSRMAFNRISNVLDALDSAYPHGMVAASEIDENLIDATWCFGQRYSESEPVSHWMMTNVTVVDENYSDSRLARDFYSESVRDFWNGAVENMEVRLLADDVLKFSRFQRGLYATQMIDQLHSIYAVAYGANIFESNEWQSLEENDYYSQAAKAYKSSVQSYADDGFLTGEQKQRVRLSTLQAFLNDGQALNDSDLRLMRSYYPRLEDSYTQCVMRNSDGLCTLNVTHYTGPSNAVHANNLKPEYLVELAGLTFSDAEGEEFLSMEDATAMLNSSYMMALHSDEALSQWSRIESRIAKYNTGAHYNGRAVNPDELYNKRDFYLRRDAADMAPSVQRR